ncbi:hypothetical protein GS887_26795 [Rhodococcus hoagii]|nr:hypothetical protein [Prescottella equi]NKR23564.1 hypothetical protein [Prescottella equi]NKU37556.1 hypothetical protein [Prescottella equi]
MATGPDAARSQRRALEKLIVLDAAAAAEDLPLVSALTGVEDQRLQDQEALRIALRNVGVQWNENIGEYTASLPIWG